jgi:hypothetical protein
MSLILLFSLSGCQDKEQKNTEAQEKHDAKIAQQARAEALAEYEAEKKSQLAQVQATEAKIQALKVPPTTETNTEKGKDKLSDMGVKMDKGTITIDTNKTKDFFNSLSKKMEVQMKKVSHDLDKGIIKSKEAGIDIDNGHINIDLNKTQDLLEEWGKKIEVFSHGFDDMIKSSDKNSTDKGQ